jgi:ABC-type uncharacterized transport system permease subunit
MPDISLLLSISAFALYGLSLYFHLQFADSKLRFALGFAGALLHVLSLLQAGSVGFYSSLAWVSALMAMVAHSAMTVSKERFLPALSVCIAIICLVLNLTMPPSARAIDSWQIQVHAASALMAYAFLSLAALQSILLILLELRLRSPDALKSSRWWPPLSRLERQLFQLIGVGFLLLSATLVTGVLFINNWFEQHLVHKTVLTLAAWLVFGVLLLGHWRLGWRGKQAAYACLGGMLLLALAFFGSKFVLELLLKRTV